MGIRYSALPGHTTEISNAMKELLSSEWGEGRGFEVVKVGISSVTANEEDEKMIKEMQRNVAFMDPARAMAYTVGAQGAAVQAAASNPAGAMTGFMGMGMAQDMGGNTMQTLAGMVQQQQPTAQPIQDGWKCAYGTMATGKFCPECGDPFDNGDIV